MNKQLEKMYYVKIISFSFNLNNSINFFYLIRGYNIGVRLIEDFLARASLGRCADFRETAEVISKVYNNLPKIVKEILLNWLNLLFIRLDLKFF